MWIKTILPMLLFVNGVLLAQPPASAEKEDIYEKKYQKRITKDYLSGVYIPRDLADCFVQLNKLIDKESRVKFKNLDERTAVTKLHFSFGRWMIHNWGFFEGSRLSHYFKEIGVSYPDDMAKFIILTYHRYLNKEKLEVKLLIDHFQKKQKDKAEAKKKQGTIIHEEKRKRKQ